MRAIFAFSFYYIVLVITATATSLNHVYMSDGNTTNNLLECKGSKCKKKNCVEYNEFCLVTSECCKIIPHVECLDKLCQCADGYYFEERYDECVPFGVDSGTLTIILCICIPGGFVLICWIIIPIYKHMVKKRITSAGQSSRTSPGTETSSQEQTRPPPVSFFEFLSRLRNINEEVEIANVRPSNPYPTPQIPSLAELQDVPITAPPSIHPLPPSLIVPSAPVEDLPPSYDEVAHASHEFPPVAPTYGFNMPSSDVKLP